MFIEPSPKRIASLQRSEIFLSFDNTLRSCGALVCSLWISYKHLAALRPAQILSANFRNRVLGSRRKEKLKKNFATQPDANNHRRTDFSEGNRCELGNDRRARHLRLPTRLQRRTQSEPAA